MKILYYDVFCGISGDMNLSALLDLGVDFDYLKQELSKLKINDEFELIKRQEMRKGISGTKLEVKLKNEEKNHHHDHHHQHRTFKMIRNMISQSELHEKVKKRAIKMFEIIAVAEGKVHHKEVDEVHFHEVGATDSIVDIVGAAICLEALGVDKIYASHVQVGGGFVQCAHGKMPVPAPATSEILKDVPINMGIVPFETTTPTGAAILKANVDEFLIKSEMHIEKIGYGVGYYDFEIPNVLRVYLGTEANQTSTMPLKEQWMMETNIDDMNSELYYHIEKKLFDNGALDVYKTPIMMKKNRPAVKLSVLYEEKYRESMHEIIFTETTSVGLREYPIKKYELEREGFNLQTKYGNIPVKKVYYNKKVVNLKPEYDACDYAALKYKVPLKKVYQEVYLQLEGEKHGY